jgi:hypothetical protein
MKDEHFDERGEKRASSPAAILTAILNHVSALVRKEVDLARAEINESLTRAGVAVALLVVAVIFVLTALEVLAASLVAAVVDLGVAPGLAALLVGVAFLLIALVLVLKARSELKKVSLAPRRTIESITNSAKAVKESI